MSEQKKPERGEWWVKNDLAKILYCHGTTQEGFPVVEIRYRTGQISACFGNGRRWDDEWHHEPRCTGWDWVEPVDETWPKWYVSEHQHIKTFIQQTSAKWARYVFASGGESPPFECDDLSGWYEITEDYAKALLTESASPPEILDNSVSPFGSAMTVPTNRVAVRLFVPRRVMDDQNVDYPVRCCWSQSEIKDVATWVEVKHDTNGFFIERSESSDEKHSPFRCPSCGGMEFGSTLEKRFDGSIWKVGEVCHSCGWSGQTEPIKVKSGKGES